MPLPVLALIVVGTPPEPGLLAVGMLSELKFQAAILAAGAEEFGQRVYNVTGGSQISLSEAAEIVRQTITDADIEVGPGHLHLDRQGPYDISAAERDLGYKPEWPVERGIPDYIAWLREHPY